MIQFEINNEKYAYFFIFLKNKNIMFFSFLKILLNTNMIMMTKNHIFL